ncbi:MAG: adenosine deaminase [Ignavibacteriales bacterium]|nr:adenosine deaminase [Ignavibacteriales bacterium]
MIDTESFIRKMPKVELHVHLEGSVRPTTFLELAKRHHIALPADTIEGLRKWYVFRDFSHFIEIYMAISSCLRTPEDIELITREFLIGQAEQNIVYSEVTFTPYNQLLNCRLGMHEQLDAVNIARAWGEKALGVRMGVIVDIPRERSSEAALTVARFVVDRYGDGIIAQGLGGPEQKNPASKFRRAFETVHEAGVPCVVHAGETDGPLSIWNAIEVAKPRRIGHGVRCIEDPRLMDYLKQTQLPLEVCPTSNICLGVFPSIEQHCLPRLLEYGLKVTLNSDDPPLFNTTLTDEFLAASRYFGLDAGRIKRLLLDAVEVSLLAESERRSMRGVFIEEFSKLESRSS